MKRREGPQATGAEAPPTAAQFRDASREIRRLLAANELQGYLSFQATWALRCLEHVAGGVAPADVPGAAQQVAGGAQA